MPILEVVLKYNLKPSVLLIYSTPVCTVLYLVSSLFVV
jgi:hypothetical protein